LQVRTWTHTHTSVNPWLPPMHSKISTGNENELISKSVQWQFVVVCCWVLRVDLGGWVSFLISDSCCPNLWSFIVPYMPIKISLQGRPISGGPGAVSWWVGGSPHKVGFADLRYRSVTRYYLPFCGSHFGHSTAILRIDHRLICLISPNPQNLFPFLKLLLDKMENIIKSFNHATHAGHCSHLFSVLGCGLHSNLDSWTLWVPFYHALGIIIYQIKYQII